VLRLNSLVKEVQNQALRNEQINLQEIFLVLMEMFMNRLTPREVYELAQEIMLLFEEYHGTVEDMAMMPNLNVESFRIMDKNGKALMLKIKGRLEKVGNKDC